jgi:hypothetical protein
MGCWRCVTEREASEIAKYKHTSEQLGEEEEETYKHRRRRRKHTSTHTHKHEHTQYIHTPEVVR